MKILKNKGFTIIELLVVLAVIAILSSIVMMSTDAAKQKSRDTRRVSNVREIAKALVLYADNNSIFPISATEITITGEDAMSVALEGDGLISEVPTDPTHPTNPYTYQTDASGTTFTISFCLETNDIQEYSQGCGNTVTP